MRISGAVSSVDVTDRAARVLGIATLAAGGTIDVTDRLARVLGEAQMRMGSAFASDGNNAGSATNPGADTVIATTGALATAGLYEIEGWAVVSAANNMALRWRDSLGANKQAARLLHNAVGPFRFRVVIRIVVNDDVVIIAEAGTGVFWGWISWRRLV